MRRLIQAITLLALAMVVIVGSAAAEPMQLVVDGQPRAYLLERPKTQGPRPTIIMLHGANGTAERLAQQTGLARLGPQDGFAAVFPQSRASVWNRFSPGKESPQAIEFFRKFGGPPNDIGFLKMLVADLVRRGISDPARIYLAGLSNGGLMTLSMFCFEGGMFAGIGLVVASMTEQTGEECRPARPLPIVMLNGTADEMVPYRGGAVAPLDPRSPATFTVWSTDRLVTYFRRLNGCARPSETAILPGQHAQRIEVERSTNCAGGPVIAYKVVGGTHTSTPAALNTGRLLLDFFRDKVRGGAAAADATPSVGDARPQQPVAAGAFNYITYRRFDGPTLVTGAVRRTSADEWIETNTRGSRWTFRSIVESSSEVVFYDRSRDIYFKADLVARKMFVRKGTVQDWVSHSDIVRTEK